MKMSTVLHHAGPEVTAVHFLEPLPLLFTADSAGTHGCMLSRQALT